MNRSVAHVLTTEKTYFGYTTCEIFGILLMIVPFLIGLKFEAVDYWFEVFGHKVQEKRTEIRPDSISITLSIILYFGLCLRFNIFKTNNLLNGIISVVRMFLNCSVLAMLIRIAYPIGKKGSPGLKEALLGGNYEVMILVLAVILTWAGVRLLAGYSWGACIYIGAKHISEVSEKMELLGWLFIFFATAALFLQIKDWNQLRDFVGEFKGTIQPHVNQIRDSMGAASYDAAEKASSVASFAKKSASGMVKKASSAVDNLRNKKD